MDLIWKLIVIRALVLVMMIAPEDVLRIVVIEEIVDVVVIVVVVNLLIDFYLYIFKNKETG